MGLAFTKLLSWIFMGSTETKILMVGLDAAGKTTILFKLKLGQVVTTIATVDSAHLEVLLPRYTRTYICSGQQNDKDRISEARDELHRLMNENEIQDAVLLVLANKQDLPHAMNVAELTEKLGLHSLNQRKWHIQSTCATNGEGLYEGLDWISANIANKRLGRLSLGQPPAIGGK